MPRRPSTKRSSPVTPRGVAWASFPIRDTSYVTNTRPSTRLQVRAVVEPTIEPKGCRCGDVLRGVMDPSECPLFATACSPEHPIGPCMVSSEGSCAAFYKYLR